MRKFEIALLAAALCLALTACGGSPSPIKQEPATLHTQLQEESVITIERINEAFVANREGFPKVSVLRQGVKFNYNDLQQINHAKENYANKQWACQLGPEMEIRDSIGATYNNLNGVAEFSNVIEFSVEKMQTGGYLISGNAIANFYDNGNNEIITAKSDKPFSFSFKYNPDKNEVWDMLYSVPEPITLVPQFDLGFPDTADDFKNMLPANFAGETNISNGLVTEQYKTGDITNVEVLCAESADEPRYDLITSKHYHVLITLNDGRKVYTEFAVETLKGKVTASEIGHGIIVE